MIGAEDIGRFFGKLVKGNEDDPIQALKSGLEKFFSVVGDYVDFNFSAESEGKKLVTRSKCPVHKYYSRWCNEGCMKFIQGFTKVYGDISVRRVSKQPESEYCVFEFEL